MMAKRNPPNIPLSKYDPRNREMSFGKIPEPQRRHEKERMCWCGDPSCLGGLVGGAPSTSSTSTGGNMGNFGNTRDDYERMKRMMFRDINPFMMPSDPYVTGDFGEPAQRSGAPSSYTAAREAVKDYILEVNHDTAWSDVIGNDTARAALTEAIEEPKLHPELYKYYGMKPPKGVMLFGPPGCGKTMFAKAAAAAVGRVYGAKAEVLVINGPSIQSPYVGKTEEIIRAIFEYAREYQVYQKHPLTVFFDEAEVLFPDRTGRTRRVAPWEESQVAQFLAEMDGLNTVGAFVILATNRPEAIDEALLRDGRCDRKIKVERPTKDAVEHIIRKSFKDIPLGAPLDEIVMAGAESFFNPHYVIREGHIIAGMINAAGEAKIKDTAVNFCLEHIVSGAMVAGLSRRSKSFAFARDRDSGKREGVKVSDVLKAVKEIFEENKPLEHAFAIREFAEGLHLNEMTEPRGTVQ